MKIVGICRFAFVGKGDWLGMTSPSTANDQALLDAQAALLYADERMERRLLTLEHICLASLKQQSDPDFELIMLTSQRMPSKWKQRLEAVISKLPQVTLVYSEATSTEEALRPELRARAAQNGKPVVQFRLDGDDAVGVDFVKTIRRNALKLRGYDRFALSFPRGLSVMSYEGQAPSFWQTWRPFTGAGVAARLIAPGRSIFATNHFELPRNMLGCLDPEPVGHLVLRWDSGDTARHGTPPKPWGYEKISRSEFDAQITESFPALQGFDWSTLRQK